LVEMDVAKVLAALFKAAGFDVKNVAVGMQAAQEWTLKRIL